MSLIEPPTSMFSSSTLSLNDLPVQCPHSDLGRTMSLPYVKKRLQVFRQDSIKRQSTPRDSEVGLQLRCDQTSLSSSPATDDIKDQGTVTFVLQVSSPTRKRSQVQQWLVQQSERFGRFRARHDSVLSEDMQKALHLASHHTKCTIAGPDGKPLPAYVVDDFFKLYAAGGSDWRKSWRWEIHLDKWEDHKQHPSKGDCEYCRTMREAGEEVPLLYVARSPPTSRASSLVNTNSPKERRSSEEGRFSLSIWRHGSKKKGKKPAEDQEWYSPLDGSLVSPRTQAPELPPICSRAPRAPENGIFIREAVRRQQRKPIQCSFTATPLDPRQIPVPVLSGLYPEDSSALNLSDLAQVTGCLYGASPLEEGRLSFPLFNTLLPPPTPELKPEERLIPAPEPLRLEDSQIPPTGAPVNTSSLARRHPRATKVQRGGFPEPIALINASSTTQQSALATLLDPLHSRHPAPNSKRRSPPIHPLPTPPDSRNNSSSNASSIPDLTFGTTGSLPARPAQPRRVPTGPADRDASVCTLSDTTGSLLPDCPVYVNAREARDRRNESMARRHWPGGCIWRYHCED